MDLDLRSAVEVTREIVREQARVLLRRWPAIEPISYERSRDYSTSADLEVERAIKSALRSSFPDHGFLGEETGEETRASEYRWLIDPIDGTKYYGGLSSLFAISVGLLRGEEPVAGVVHSPPSGQCFYASAGSGAFLDGRRLEGPRARRLGDVILEVDTPKSDKLAAEERSWFERKLVELTRRVYRVRAIGVGSLAACWVASGALDAYLDLTGYTKPEDRAAGRAILKEAGLRVERLDAPVGPPRLLAAPPGLWESLKDVLLA